MEVSISIEWILGLIATAVGGSYWFTWITFKWNRESNHKLWTAFNEFKDNDVKHLEDRIRDLENK